MNSVQGDIVQPKVLIIPRYISGGYIQNPTVTGASVIGMINISGAVISVVTDNAGTWTALN